MVAVKHIQHSKQGKRNKQVQSKHDNYQHNEKKHDYQLQSILKWFTSTHKFFFSIFPEIF